MFLRRLLSPCLWGITAYLLFSTSLFSQTTVFSDNFNNGCASNCLANTYGGWTITNNVGGTTGAAPNDWFVSCAEEGVAPPGCGSSCIGDATLHIGANPGAGGDMGASYNETGATNATFKRVQSPTISTVGFTTLTLNFDFIAFGSSACSDDRAQLWLSTDNGATWPAGFQYCLNSPCCGACNGYSQGQWTLFTLALPAAFDNNPNVRVGFHWRNNGNGSGTDPSVAIDDVRITAPIVLPAQIITLAAKPAGNDVLVDWKTESEQQLARFEIERSKNLTSFDKIGTVSANGGSAGHYSFRDAGAGSGEMYYRLKLVDRNGQHTYSNIVRVTQSGEEALVLSAFSSPNFQHELIAQLWAAEPIMAQVEVFDLQGKSILRLSDQHLIAGQNKLSLALGEVAAGTYMLSIRSQGQSKGYGPVHISRKFVLSK